MPDRSADDPSADDPSADDRSVPDPGHELVDVVDADDRVIATVPRRTMRVENLRHRAVGIAVFAGDGRLLVHRRAEHKDVWPGRWDVCAGGVVGAGESYADAARRELAEELGIVDAEPQPLAVERYEDDDVRAISHLFRVVHDGPYRFDDGEVVEARLVTVDELRELASTAAFVPDSWTVALPHLGPFAAVWTPHPPSGAAG